MTDKAVNVRVLQQVLLPERWIAVIRKRDRVVVALFRGSDDASDWLYTGPDTPDEYELEDLTTEGV